MSAVHKAMTFLDTKILMPCGLVAVIIALSFQLGGERTDLLSRLKANEAATLINRERIEAVNNQLVALRSDVRIMRTLMVRWDERLGEILPPVGATP